MDGREKKVYFINKTVKKFNQSKEIGKKEDNSMPYISLSPIEFCVFTVKRKSEECCWQ